MLDIDTLNALHDLMANTLYAAEVAHLPQITLEEEQDLVIRARIGEPEARQALILSCLQYALGKARVAYNLYTLAHDDLLDLAQVSNLEMVSNLDRALLRENAVAYLRGIARRAILLYCGYRSSLISKPASLTQKQREKRGQVTVESLHAPLTYDGKLTRLEFIVAPVSDPAQMVEGKVSEEERRAQHATLYHALDALTPRQREVLTLRYGLDGQPPMRRDIIGSSSQVYDVEQKALKQLRALLGTQTIQISPSEEE